MITALDTNVLVDVFAADPTHGAGSGDALRDALARGSLIACEVVWAEVAAGFGSARDAAHELEALGVSFSPLDAAASGAAGDLFRAHRRHDGQRARIIADFLIGAHALHHADRLLTRDRGFYRSYFVELTVEDPSAA